MRTFRALHELAVATSGQLDLYSLAAAVVERGREIFEVDSVALYLVDDSGTLIQLAESASQDWPSSENIAGPQSVRTTVLRERKPQVVNDYPAWPGASPTAIARGVRSAAAVPLVATDRAIGVLIARSTELGRFDADHLDILLLLAAQVGPAIEAARLHSEAEKNRAELRSRTRQLEALYEVSLAAFQSEDAAAIARSVLQQALALTGCEVGTVQRYDPDIDQTSLLVAEGYRDESNLPPPRSERSQQVRAIRDGAPQFLEDLRDSGRFRSFEREGVISLALLPVVTEGRVLGVIQLGSRTQITFSTEEIRLLETLANQLGGALQKAELIAQTRRVLADLQTSEAGHARLAAILEATSDLVGIADNKGRRVFLNRAGRELLGMTPDQDLAQIPIETYRAALSVKQREDEILPTAARAGIWRGETTYLRADGTEVPVLSVVIAHRDAQGEVEFYSTIARDISEQKALQAQLFELAQTDGLTGVANRRAFDRALLDEWRRAMRQRTPIALIIADVDFFKRFNDSTGHLAGDACLQRLASTLRSGVRRPGELVARYGGEEFAVLLPNADRESAQAVAESLRHGVERLGLPHPDSPVCSYVTLSLGVATLVPRKGSKPDELLRRADQALYRAKEAGRDQVVLAPERDATQA